VATSAEYHALGVQAYRAAAFLLDQALADSSWTASVEQEGQVGYESLPPAIILDVDETVLDNTTYQARLIDQEEVYRSESWKAWVREAAAIPVPGALEFTRLAASRGVRVIYLTNRDADVEEPTRANLAQFGFPLGEDDDAVLTQGELPEWRPSDKTPRRAHVAKNYRILMLFGDNLGDFAQIDRAGLDERSRLVEQYGDYWGTRWIVLPNPQYGSWETATFGHDYSLPPPERLARKKALIQNRANQ
jgi:acid phosphatase